MKSKIFYKFETINRGSQLVIDTDDFKDILLKDIKRYNPILNFISESSRNLNIPLYFYFSLYHKISSIKTMLGQSKLNYNPFINNDTPDEINLNDIIKEVTGIIKKEDFNSIFNKLNNTKMDILSYNYLFNFIFENIRLEKFNTLPNRSKCIYLFESLEDCEIFISEKSIINSFIYEVTVQNKKTLLKFDLNYIEDYDIHSTTTDIENNAIKYWNQEISNEPFIEFLFQGICEMKLIKELK